MNFKGYDAWKLAGPDDDGPTCDCCGCASDDLRMDGGDPICAGCFAGKADDFYDLETPSDYAERQDAERGDFLYHQRQDRRAEG